MDIIKLFYNPIDVKPSYLLLHFLKTLGFYIESHTDYSCPETGQSIVDIYIVSSDYAQIFRQRLDSLREEKSLLIFKDGWSASGLAQTTQVISYDDAVRDDHAFLLSVIAALKQIMIQTGVSSERLVFHTPNWHIIMNEVASFYTENSIASIMQYSKSLCGQDQLFHIMSFYYDKYITSVEELIYQYGMLPILRYILLRAKYELDYIYKQNSRKYLYDPDLLSTECEALLRQFGQNEELLFLNANIHFELQDKWQQACGEYEDIRVSHCAYGDFKGGRIVRLYLEEYDKAVVVLKRALKINPDYYAAWYQLAACYEELGEYRLAVEYFSRIIEILREPYKRRLLAPLDLEYLYKAHIKIAFIRQYNLGEPYTAQSYLERADQIKSRIDDDTYLKLVWPEILDDPNLTSKLRDELRMRVTSKAATLFCH